MFRQSLKSFIYPTGKVHKNYPTYVGWSLLSNMIGSIEGVLATHSMLSVVGKESSELTISANYIGKDIIGQAGGLWYMNKMGKKADKEPKKFANYSIAFWEVSIWLEHATPFIPFSAFLPVAGLATIGKNICCTGIGAVNMKVVHKLAQEDNIGEIYAKISVLNTLGSSIGMGMGLGIAAAIPDHSTRLCLIPIFSILRVYSYKKSIKGLI